MYGVEYGPVIWVWLISFGTTESAIENMLFHMNSTNVQSLLIFFQYFHHKFEKKNRKSIGNKKNYVLLLRCCPFDRNAMCLLNVPIRSYCHFLEPQVNRGFFLVSVSVSGNFGLSYKWLSTTPSTHFSNVSDDSSADTIVKY